MSRNVFDNPSFFSKYMELRKDYNHNDLLEHPQMERLCPSLKGKRVIDLGCGYGSYARSFIEKGASYYLGIDASENMIRKAESENEGDNIEYRVMNLDDLGSIEGNFDLAYSSLVFHYIEDFDKLLRNVHSILNDGGILLFSQICNPSDIFFKQFCHFVSAYCRQLHLCVHSYFVQITTFLSWNTTFSLY